MTMYGTSLPLKVTKAEIMLHCLVWCGVKPVADLITIIRPKGGDQQHSSCGVGFDSQVVCGRAISKLDTLPFGGSNDPKSCRWKLAHRRTKPRAGPVFRTMQWQEECSPVTPPTGCDIKEETSGPWIGGGCDIKQESDDEHDNQSVYGVMQVDSKIRPTCASPYANIQEDPEV